MLCLYRGVRPALMFLSESGDRERIMSYCYYEKLILWLWSEDHSCQSRKPCVWLREWNTLVRKQIWWFPDDRSLSKSHWIVDKEVDKEYRTAWDRIYRYISLFRPLSHSISLYSEYYITEEERVREGRLNREYIYTCKSCPTLCLL